MAAFLIYVLSKLNHLKPNHGNRLGHRFRHHLGIHAPPILHAVLDSELLSQFSDVFVIGDVHGCYDEMMELLETADAKDHNVLKIFVGDLVNKGPKNAQVLQYVRQNSSCLSVRGNHDEIIVKEIMENNSKAWPEKFEWLSQLSIQDKDYLRDLPYTISIPSLNCIVVHAGLIPGMSLHQMIPYHLVNMRNLVVEDYFAGDGIKATKFQSAGDPWASLWPGPQHVYFGHDAKRMLQLYPYATGLDTGCVYGKRLTGLFIQGPKKGTFVHVDSKKMYQKV